MRFTQKVRKKLKLQCVRRAFLQRRITADLSSIKIVYTDFVYEQLLVLRIWMATMLQPNKQFFGSTNT